MQNIISHSGYYLHLRQDYLEICDNNHCAAQILDKLEYWTAYRIEEIKRITSLNQELKGSKKLEIPDMWLRETIGDFVNGLLGCFGEKSVREALKLLEKKGFIISQKSKLFSRIKKFLFCTEKIQKALDDWRKSLCSNETAKTPYPEKADLQERQNYQTETAKLPDGNGKSATALHINNNQEGNSPLSNIQGESKNEMTSTLNDEVVKEEAPVNFSEPEQEEILLEPENLKFEPNVPPRGDEEIFEVEIIEEGSAIVASTPESNREKKYSPEVEQTIVAYEKLGVIPCGMDLNKWAEEEIGSTVALYRKSGAILKSSPNDIDRDFIVYLAKKLKNKENTTGAIAWIRAMEESPKRWQELSECVSSWQRERFLATDEGKSVKRAYNKASNSFLSEHEDLGIFD